MKGIDKDKKQPSKEIRESLDIKHENSPILLKERKEEKCKRKIKHNTIKN